MLTQPLHVARIDKSELFDLPAEWTDRERGQYLRLLLGFKGIDPDRFYHMAYYPLPRCWLLTQEPAPDRETETGYARDPEPAEERYYLQVIAQFRWTARVACSALAAQSRQFALFGCKYQLPPKPREMTPADLAQSLGGTGPEGKPLPFFTSEGGWQTPPSDN
jgi:hypothetical protein